MHAISWALGLATIALLVQFSLWKIALPRRQSRAIVVIFAGTTALGLFVNIVQPFGAAGGLYLHSTYDFLAVALFQFATLCAYIITYSAVEVDSPSLLITLLIEKGRDSRQDRLHKSLTERDLRSILNDDVLVRPRLRDLLRDGHLSAQNGQMQLTSKGRKFVAIFIAYRALLRAPKGG